MKPATRLPPHTTGIALALCSTLAACGGGGDYGLPVVNTPAPAAATLSASVSSLALAVNNPSLNPALTGNARTITITNTGSLTAQALAVTATAALPSGTITSSTCSSTLAPGASCMITIMPGVTASAAPGDTAAVPATLSIAGSNTNTLNVNVQVLTYGSVYQGGYVFAVDDTTTASGSIGGTVAALADSANPASGILWQSSATATGASSTTDGAANTATIVAALGAPTSGYAAGLCKATISGYADWYLPSVCEMGYDSSSAGSGCGSSSSPLRQNLQSSLVDNGNIGSLSGLYWTSTEYAALPTTYSWAQDFATGGGSLQAALSKPSTEGVRCVRALTL